MSPAPAVAPRAASGRRRWSGSRRGPGAPPARDLEARDTRGEPQQPCGVATHHVAEVVHPEVQSTQPDRKSTRLNSSHGYISYAVFCLKKKKNENNRNDSDDE